jgi:methylated-DNA-[protein]-cysteine S-methyltransferase
MKEQIWLHSPVGWLRIAGDESGVNEAQFEDKRTGDDTHASSVVLRARDELAAYFAGELREFNVKLAPEGTAFQRQVWDLLTGIPFGDTRTYLQLALRMGKAEYTRAVGTANGANPVAVIIPCHRVIGADCKLTGYAGGIHRKEWLLAHEARLANKGQLRMF